MKYEKPQIVCVDDAAKTIQQMSKTWPVIDTENGSGTEPGYLADE
jgi:hypothetical protein